MYGLDSYNNERFFAGEWSIWGHHKKPMRQIVTALACETQQAVCNPGGRSIWHVIRMAAVLLARVPIGRWSSELGWICSFSRSSR